MYNKEHEKYNDHEKYNEHERNDFFLDHKQIDKKPDNNNLESSKAWFILGFYFFIMFFAGILLYPLFASSDNFLIEYNETDVLLRTLQTKNGIGIVLQDDFENSVFKSGVSSYELDDGFLLVTTKSMFGNLKKDDIDEEFLKKIFKDGYILDNFKVYKVLLSDISEDFFNLYNFDEVPKTDVIIESEKSLNTSADALINFIIFIIITIVFVAVSFKMLKNEFIRLDGVKQTLVAVIVSIGIVYLVNIVANMLVIILSALFQERVVDSINQMTIVNMLRGDYAILVIITVVIIGPFIEEMVFRKAMFSLIPNKKAAFAASALLFGLIHVLGETSLVSFFLSLIPYLAPGIAFSYIYLKYDENVLIPTFAHMGLNLLSVILVFIL